jgi:hypothetical protein
VQPTGVLNAGATLALQVSALTAWSWEDVIVGGDVVANASCWPHPGDPLSATPLCVVTGTANLAVDEERWS